MYNDPPVRSTFRRLQKWRKDLPNMDVVQEMPALGKLMIEFPADIAADGPIISENQF